MSNPTKRIHHNPVPHLKPSIKQIVFTNTELSAILNGIDASIISRDRVPLGIPSEVPLTYEWAFQIYMMRCWLGLMYQTTGVKVKRKTYIRQVIETPDLVKNFITAAGGGESDFAQLVDAYLIKKTSRQLIA